MRKKIGKLQIEYLETIKEIHIVLIKMQEFLNMKDLDTVLVYRNVILKLEKGLPKLLSVFGYEHDLPDYMEAIKLFDECQERKDILIQEDDCKNALKILIDLTDKILEHTNEKQKICNCCGAQIYYKPLSDYYDQQERKYGVEKHILETLSRKRYSCPSCFSSDRDRLIVAFLKELELDRMTCAESLLQIAPSKGIEHWIYANCPAVRYDSTDFYMQNVTFRSDVQNMSMVLDEFYDYFICSHVLEHVRDDRKAMKELYRILKREGMGLLLVPVFLDQDDIDEEWGLTEEQNWQRFGQGDHCRSYARSGLIKRLQEAGFTVHCLGKDFFGEKTFRECGLTDTSVLYVLTKLDMNIRDLILKRKKLRNTKWEEPQVSIILPAYNHEKYVTEAIESVLNQEYYNYEFLVADDGSSDGTAEKILEYEDRIDQIHLMKKNTGGQVARFLLEKSRGKYVAMMHSDDLWVPEKIRMQVIYLENHPECAACFTGCTLFDNDGNDLGNGPFMMMNKKKEEWFRFFYEYGNCLSHPSILIRRDMYMKILGRNTIRFRQLPDFEAWINLVQESEIHIIEKELTLFRWHTIGNHINTSTLSQENFFRNLVEESYIWYETIKNMEKNFFLKTFADCLKTENPTNDNEIMCEKLFILLGTRLKYCKQAAIFYLYEIYRLDGIPELLEEQYHFDIQEVYRITGEYIPDFINQTAAMFGS